MSKNEANRGFTLIELLTVIAIIGILSAIVMSSLNETRYKAANAAVKANLRNLRTQAQLYYTQHGNYATGTAYNCSLLNSLFSDPDFVKILNAAIMVGHDTIDPKCNIRSDAWVVAVRLKVLENGFDYWCVDSTGTAKLRNAVGLTEYSC